jgi:YVTN family beta-propeller protein
MLGTCCFAGVLIATIALGASPHQGLHPNAEASTDAAPLCTSATNVAEPTFYAEMAQANMRMHEDMEVAASGDVDRDFARMMIPHHLVRSPRGQFAYVTIGGLNQVKAFRTSDFEQVAAISVGDLPHGIWPSGDGSRVYVGIENGDAVTAIDTATNRVIATIPNGQAAQALVYVPEAAPSQAAGAENLLPLGLAGVATHFALAAPGSRSSTTVSLFDQGLTQMLQAAVVGLEPSRPYMLALTSNSDGTGEIQPVAKFVTNPAGAAIVNAVGPIRQIVDPSIEGFELRRYLAVIAVENGGPGQAVQLQQPEITRSSSDQ